mmetsp:Transcript_38623/g.28494  ORF Transcript_38623/g.28494 Transcript_38623/m.28494 type:complete len:162 (+) Transcript_38623:182-667(+)
MQSEVFEFDDQDEKQGPIPPEIEEKQIKKKKFRQIKMREIMAYYQPKSMVVLGLSSSVLVSVTMPLFGYLFSLYVFALQDAEDTNEFWRYKMRLDLCFFFLCISIGLFTFTQKIGYAIGGENLISKFRAHLFEEILYKHCAWFDSKARAVGALTTVISEDI